MNITCRVCYRQIRTMCFMGTDHCSTNCLKILKGEGLIPERINA